MKFSVRFKNWLAGTFRGRFTSLYSTVDYGYQVPVQMQAYDLAIQKYVQLQDCTLDVGFGMGYGLHRLSRASRRICGIEVDSRAVRQARKMLSDNSGIQELVHYAGKSIPYGDRSFDVITCIDVLEHVPDYADFLRELCRVSRRVVLISTPNRRPEYTRPDGRPKNRWHLREWSRDELNEIIRSVLPTVSVEWHLINGPFAGPFTISNQVQPDTLALTPALLVRA